MQKKDRQVQQILTDLFPKKTIVMMNPEALNHQGGGIHCYTYNEPLRKTTPP
jgi:agmatine/peptidylarginine deiminase